MLLKGNVLCLYLFLGDVEELLVKSASTGQQWIPYVSLVQMVFVTMFYLQCIMTISPLAATMYQYYCFAVLLLCSIFICP